MRKNSSSLRSVPVLVGLVAVVSGFLFTGPPVPNRTGSDLETVIFDESLLSETVIFDETLDVEPPNVATVEERYVFHDKAELLRIRQDVSFVLAKAFQGDTVVTDPDLWGYEPCEGGGGSSYWITDISRTDTADVPFLTMGATKLRTAPPTHHDWLKTSGFTLRTKYGPNKTSELWGRDFDAVTLEIDPNEQTGTINVRAYTNCTLGTRQTK